MAADPTTETPDRSHECQSCGDQDDQLTLVRRLWVTPEEWDTQGSVADGPLEWWCFVCRTHYPHQEQPAAT
jgi:hypothetical protein